MVGSGVLMEALEREEVTSVVTVGRRSTGRSHPKLEEIVHDDFFDYAPVRDRLGGFDACFFCLGVSAAGMTEEKYHLLTYDLTLAAAETLVELNPQMTLCYLSGSGADSSESGRWMWARVKGKIENKLVGMPFKGAYMFRPAFIQPMKGVRSRTRLYAIMYGLLGPLYPVLRLLFPKYVTNSVTVGRAMIRVAGHGHSGAILENSDINAVGAEKA
jgi:hypothetical protein